MILPQFIQKYTLRMEGGYFFETQLPRGITFCTILYSMKAGCVARQGHNPGTPLDGSAVRTIHVYRQRQHLLAAQKWN